jgi:L-arabinose isomerase
VREFHTVFDVQPDCPADDLAAAARTSVALDRLVADHRLGSLAYYYKGTGVAENETTLASIILGTSLLTARGVPVAGEYEVKNAQAMKIMDLLGAGGSFTEYYAMDFRDDVVLMGHDGPGHLAIAEGPTKVRPLAAYHGKVGRGLSIEMAVKHGPVTLLSVIETPGGRLALLCAEAESVPGPILEIGNTNSRYRFACGAREFVNSTGTSTAPPTTVPSASATSHIKSKSSAACSTSRSSAWSDSPGASSQPGSHLLHPNRLTSLHPWAMHFSASSSTGSAAWPPAASTCPIGA